MVRLVYHFIKAKNVHTLPEHLRNEPYVSRHVSAVFTTSKLIKYWVLIN